MFWLDIPGSVATNSRKMKKRLCESFVLCRKLLSLSVSRADEKSNPEIPDMSPSQRKKSCIVTN